MAASTSPANAVAFATLVVLVATNLVAIRFTDRELAPFWNAGARFALAAGIFAAIIAVRRPAPPHGRAIVGSVVYGLLAFAAFFALVYVGLVHATAALGQTVLALGPLITLLLAASVGLERVRGRSIAGALLALIGIAVVFGAQQHLEVPVTSVLALVGAATSFAAAGILSKRLPPIDPLWQNAVGTAVGSAVLLLVSLSAGEAWVLPRDPATWLWFAYLVIPGTVLVFLLLLHLLHRLPATVVSYQFVLAPIVSITLGAIVLGEPAGPGTLLGVGIVVAGVYLGALVSDRDDGRQPQSRAGPPSEGRDDQEGHI
jgi:drug/metabolite transporter (DMT)-like permease